MRTPKIEGASIVLLGAFNPKIFQPKWFEMQKLLRPEEADGAKKMAITNEVVDVDFEWFKLQVLQDRFTVVTVDPAQFSPLRDLVVGIFTLLPHTPIETMGLNKFYHFEMRSDEQWHALGHRLAPKEDWHPLIDKAGMRSLTIEGMRKTEHTGVIKIKVEPSRRVNQHGVFIEFNEEFQRPDSAPDGASWTIEQIARHWDGLLQFCDSSAQSILALAPK